MAVTRSPHAQSGLGPETLIEGFADVSILVVGEAILDTYMNGSSGRLCQEAPVPVVDVGDRAAVPGGAANAAANVRALGGRCELLSVVGDDPEARSLGEALDRAGVGRAGVIKERDRRTLSKNRVLADGQLLLRFDEGDTRLIGPESEQLLLKELEKRFEHVAAVLVSDYGYGVLTAGIISGLGKLQRTAPRVLVVDAKNLSGYRDIGVTAVKPNYDQAMRLLSEPPVPTTERDTQVAGLGERLLETAGAEIAALTLDTEGAIVFERGKSPYRTYARAVRPAAASGAGDTFAAALALSLAAGGHTPAAAEVASAAAAVVVGKEGTATCSVHELQERFAPSGKHLDRARLGALMGTYRSQGSRVVFTNGCFDILHGGHIAYLSQAKMLGDVLVVGLNDDDSVRRLKGPGRPINGVGDRIQVLAGLSCVDHIVVFGEDTPEALIRAVRPDVFVKGGDYSRDRLPAATLVEELGGTLRILPYVSNLSTTSIIERIRNSAVHTGERTKDDAGMGRSPARAVR
jgi:D-beta-D-heptose 7-phosphate kinase/D-beta-D-heptose 1-phosphate adenosyltransferase